MNGKTFGKIGVLSIVVFMVFFLAAMLADPSWKIGMQYLSELGISPTAAVFFNTGCVIAGVLVVTFAIGYTIYNKNKLAKIAGILGVIVGALLALIGIFPMSNMSYHFPIAFGLFIGSAFMVAFMIVNDWLDKKFVLIGAIEFIMLAVTLCFAGKFSPLIETIAFFVLAATALMQSCKLIVISKDE